MIDKALKPLLIGADPLDIEVLWHRMYHMTRDYGRKGSVISGISAVDIALWDIAGKFHELPIYKLLGAIQVKDSVDVEFDLIAVPRGDATGGAPQ